MASIVRVTVLTSADVDVETANALAAEAARQTRNAGIEDNVHAYADIEHVEQADLDALAEKAAAKKVEVDEPDEADKPKQHRHVFGW